MRKITLLFISILLFFTVACGDDDAPAAPNLALASLTVSSGALTPAFDPAVTAYTVSVSNTVTNITVTGTASNTNATVTYDPTQSATLTVGSNLITVRVISTDLSATNAYQVVALRAAPNLALASLTVSSGTLTPAFNPSVTAYTVNINNAVASITVAGTVADTSASVSYSPTQPAALTVGSNLITVKVTSADLSATNAYQVVVYRISTNANLATLSLNAGTLTPAFDAAVSEYSLTAYLSNSVASATITAAAAHGGAVVSYPGGQNPALILGSNQLVVRVTAEDGMTTKDYTIRVYRMGADYTSANIGTLKYVPAGSFQRDATPANISFVSALRMSHTEITRSQYSTVMSVDPSDTGYSTGTSDPVQNVNWYHAIAFCNKLSISEGLEPVYSVTGVDFTNLAHASIPTTSVATWNAAAVNWAANGYRLPTEMEWMWAAMGANMGADPFAVNTTGYSKPFAGSTGSNSINDYAWYGYYSSGSATTATTAVAGSKLANELGFADMSGNIFEWCWDWYGMYPSGYQADYRGAASDTHRVVRGGCWHIVASNCTVASRFIYYPYYRDSGIGIRVVRP